jgi:lipoprotein-releasing system permease protein
VNWVGFIARRLVSRKKSLPVLSILGIAVGVLALTVVIAVMNGFQLGFIESILEISSYYIRVEGPAGNGEELAEKIRALSDVTSVTPFREAQGLARGLADQHGVLLRGLPPGALEADPKLAKRLDFEEGSFDIESGDSILLGAELARRLRVELGDEVTVLSVSGMGPSGAVPESAAFTVTGIFRSGFYDYDLGWAFVNFDKAGVLLAGGDAEAGKSAEYALGIKLADRFEDRRVLPAIEKIAAPYGVKVTTWRDYNSAFFGALRTEKLFMFVLVGLIFIVVGLNMYQGQRRIVLERREEIGLLRAVGAGEKAVRLVFVWDGFLIGSIGAVTGMALGLLVCFNISGFFTLLETAVNGVMGAVNFVLSPFMGNAASGKFAVFSPTVFYIKEMQARVIPREAAIIFLFGLLSAVLAAWFASGRVSRIAPAEVLRYE